MWSWAWWKATGERMLAAAAAAFVAKLGLGDMAGFDALAVDWPTAGSWALGGALAMLAFSLIGTLMPAGGKGNPALAWPPKLPE